MSVWKSTMRLSVRVISSQSIKKTSRDVAGCKAVYACSDVVYVCFSFNS